jgi:phosphopantetheinyl transferase (holo-ACP synthase)
LPATFNPTGWEAVSGVLSTAHDPFARTDMEIVNDPAGRPLVRLSGECARIARRLQSVGFVGSEKGA